MIIIIFFVFLDKMTFLEMKKLIYLICLNIVLIIIYILYSNYYNVKNIGMVSNLYLEIPNSSSIIEVYRKVEDEKEKKLVDFNDDHDYFAKLLDYIKSWKKSLDSGKTPLLTHLYNINTAHELIVREQQLESFNVSKRPKELNLTLDCSNKIYQSFLNPSIREKPAKILDLILISYELVVLEMRLFELYDTVDEIIIFETNITFKQVAKPFFFLSNLKRYQRFLDKIILITPFNITSFYSKDLSIKSQNIINPDDIPKEYKVSNIAPEFAFNKDHGQFFKIDFTIEDRARMMSLRLYEKYVRKLDENEIVIHGDIDEMPNSDIINHFKYCQVIDSKYPFQFWSTFYIYGFNYLFQADFAAPGDPYSNAYPNIFRAQDIRRLGRLRLNKAFLLPRASGCHCNRFFSGFTISLYKDMSQSDSEGLEYFHSAIIKNASLEACYDIKRKFASGLVYEKYLQRIKVNKNLQEHEIIFIPWIVLSNKHVYRQYLTN